MTGVTEEVRDSWWENMNTCRAPVNFYFHWNWEFKNHAAINTRCSNLIKPCMRYDRERESSGMLFRPCFSIREHVEKKEAGTRIFLLRWKGQIEILSPWVQLNWNWFGKNEFAIASFSFPSPSSPKKKRKKKMFHCTLLFASSDRKRKFGNSCAKEGRTTVHWSISP